MNPASDASAPQHMPAAGQWIALGVSSVLLAALLAFSVVLEMMVFASAHWQFWAAALGLAALVSLPAHLFFRNKAGLIPLLIFIAGLASLPFMTLSPVKPFIRFHAAIQPGMDIAAVERVVGDYFPPNGRFTRPALHRDKAMPGHAFYILDPDDGRYNAEAVILTLREDRVVRTDYCPD